MTTNRYERDRAGMRVHHNKPWPDLFLTGLDSIDNNPGLQQIIRNQFGDAFHSLPISGLDSSEDGGTLTYNGGAAYIDGEFVYPAGDTAAVVAPGAGELTGFFLDAVGALTTQSTRFDTGFTNSGLLIGTYASNGVYYPYFEGNNKTANGYTRFRGYEEIRTAPIRFYGTGCIAQGSNRITFNNTQMISEFTGIFPVVSGALGQFSKGVFADLTGTTFNTTSLKIDTLTNTTTGKPLKVGSTWYPNTNTEWDSLWDGTYTVTDGDIIICGAFTSTTAAVINKEVVIRGNINSILTISNISKDVIIYDVSIDLGANSLEISTSSAYIVKFVNCTILVSSTYYISISSSTPSLQILGCHFIVTGNPAVVIDMNCGEYSFVSNCTFNVTGDPANIITVSSGYGPRITNNNIRYHTSNNTTAVIISTTSSMTTINGNYIFGGVGVSGTMTAIYCNGSLSVIIGNCIAIGTSGTTVGIRLDTSSSVCIAQGNGITSDTDVSDSGTNNQGTANTATHNT